MADLINFSVDNHIALITANRFKFDNKNEVRLSRELNQISSQVNHDTNIYVVILTGTRKPFFCDGETDSVTANNVANEVAGINKPVIAAINGDAIGTGLEIALACDIRLASDSARFGLPQITTGKIPSSGGTQRLPRLIGRGKAMELILTGDVISAAEALEIGLIHQVLPPGKLLPEAEKMAETMAGKGPLALQYAKEAVLKGMDLTLEQGLRYEADLYMLLHTTHDRTEGIKAFREKRTPDFQGK